MTVVSNDTEPRLGDNGQWIGLDTGYHHLYWVFKNDPTLKLPIPLRRFIIFLLFINILVGSTVSCLNIITFIITRRWKHQKHIYIFICCLLDIYVSLVFSSFVVGAFLKGKILKSVCDNYIAGPSAMVVFTKILVIAVMAIRECLRLCLRNPDKLLKSWLVTGCTLLFCISFVYARWTSATHVLKVWDSHIYACYFDTHRTYPNFTPTQQRIYGFMGVAYLTLLNSSLIISLIFLYYKLAVKDRRRIDPVKADDSGKSKSARQLQTIENKSEPELDICYTLILHLVAWLPMSVATTSSLRLQAKFQASVFHMALVLICTGSPILLAATNRTYQIIYRQIWKSVAQRTLIVDLKDYTNELSQSTLANKPMFNNPHAHQEQNTLLNEQVVERLSKLMTETSAENLHKRLLGDIYTIEKRSKAIYKQVQECQEKENLVETAPISA